MWKVIVKKRVFCKNNLTSCVAFAILAKLPDDAVYRFCGVIITGVVILLRNHLLKAMISYVCASGPISIVSNPSPFAFKGREEILKMVERPTLSTTRFPSPLALSTTIKPSVRFTSGSTCVVAFHLFLMKIFPYSVLGNAQHPTGPYNSYRESAIIKV